MVPPDGPVKELQVGGSYVEACADFPFGFSFNVSCVFSPDLDINEFH